MFFYFIFFFSLNFTGFYIHLFFPPHLKKIFLFQGQFFTQKSFWKNVFLLSLLRTITIISKLKVLNSPTFWPSCVAVSWWPGYCNRTGHTELCIWTSSNINYPELFFSSPQLSDLLCVFSIVRISTPSPSQLEITYMKRQRPAHSVEIVLTVPSC